MKSFEEYRAQVLVPKEPDPVDAEIATARRETAIRDLGEQLYHIETHLNKHGASIATLLRHTAKAALGIDVPHLNEKKTAE